MRKRYQVRRRRRRYRGAEPRQLEGGEKGDDRGVGGEYGGMQEEAKEEVGE